MSFPGVQHPLPSTWGIGHIQQQVFLALSPQAFLRQAACRQPHTHTEGVFQYVHAHQVSSRRDGHSLPWSLPVSFTIPPLFPQTTLRLRHGKSRAVIKTPKERNQVVPGRASLLLWLSALDAPGLAVLPLHSSSQRFCLV